MKKNDNNTTEEVKKELTFDYDDCTVIWKFNPKKPTSGAYEVEIKHKKPPKKG